MNEVVAPKIWLSPFDGHRRKKITVTQHHHKLILHSSCHVQRVLVVATKVEQGKIRVGNEKLLMITGAPIASIFTKRAIRCHHK